MDDPLIGPEQKEYGARCGYNTSVNFDNRFDCNSHGVIHIMFKAKDEHGYNAGGFACELHLVYVDTNRVQMTHEVGIFCGLPESEWSFETNECVMPVEPFELALLGTLDLGKDILKENSCQTELKSK